MTDLGTLGQVTYHASDEDGGAPDVGVMISLGGQRALWIGELLNRDGIDPHGMIFFGDGVRRVEPLDDWEAIRDLFSEHVAPALRNAHVDHRDDLYDAICVAIMDNIEVADDDDLLGVGDAARAILDLINQPDPQEAGASAQ